MSSDSIAPLRLKEKTSKSMMGNEQMIRRPYILQREKACLSPGGDEDPEVSLWSVWVTGLLLLRSLMLTTRGPGTDVPVTF